MSNEFRPCHIWPEVRALIVERAPRNVRMAVAYPCARSGDGYGETVLLGNDGLILTHDPYIAASYVCSDWDSINCCAGRDA